ncbi:MAG: hypothetical protein LBS99_07345 [Clostridiales bacterium]|jgi:hypothetical protein|nr:hypothetical protein [Clostridiales bacterium]
MDYLQIRQLKAQHEDALLFVRVGDFYEAYDGDAITISNQLDLILTGRDMQGASDRVPMAGIPYHAFDKYAARLIEKGYKVAVAESLDGGAEARRHGNAAAQEQTAVKIEPATGLTVKSQVAEWSDWSTEILPDDVRAAAEWLIANGYENESDVQSAFYYRQTSLMSDDFNAEENDNAAILRVAERYMQRETENAGPESVQAVQTAFDFMTDTAPETTVTIKDGLMPDGEARERNPASVDILESLKSYLGHGFSSGSYPGDDYLAFQKIYISYLSKLAAENGWELAAALKGHYSFSAFFKNDAGKFVYMSVGDVRGSRGEWFDSILVRTARHERDYTGGRNNYTSLPELAGSMRELFGEAAIAAAYGKASMKPSERSAETPEQAKTEASPTPLSAQEIKNVREDKKMGSYAEELTDDPLYGGQAGDAGAEERTIPDGSAKPRERLTPEELVGRADAEFIRAMRDGRYADIVDGLADLGYSVRNVMLIKSQLPSATKVAGVNQWNYQRRSVTKGERALKILAYNGDGESKEENAESAESGGNAAKSYRLSFVFDVSQTHGKDVKEKKCMPGVLEKYYEGIKRTVESLAREYTFAEGERSGVSFDGKTITVQKGLSREDTLKAMIRGVAAMHTEGKAAADGREISQGRAMFNEIEGTATAHIVSRRLGLGDMKLKIIDFSGFDDGGLLRMASNLNNVRMRSSRITNAVERYISEAQSADEIRKVREEEKAAAAQTPARAQTAMTPPVQAVRRPVAEAEG